MFVDIHRSQIRTLPPIHHPSYTYLTKMRPIWMRIKPLASLFVTCSRFPHGNPSRGTHKSRDAGCLWLHQHSNGYMIQCLETPARSDILSALTWRRPRDLLNQKQEEVTACVMETEDMENFPPQAPEAVVQCEAASARNCGPCSSLSQLSTSFNVTISSFTATSLLVPPNAVASVPPLVAYNIRAPILAGADIDPSPKASPMNNWVTDALQAT
ncbi:hypothetical protein G5714_008620 [Onychostoma macrolepis]|uniref:Uncharacterized protein n=1 Tax=Onychostoma macrolepis TaxID=369639 RepID=A0A7J6CW60_9TELE|nr:hypothetical protein G5714_008620 [Onychostoma macrolepis]